MVDSSKQKQINKPKPNKPEPLKKYQKLLLHLR